MRSRDMIDEAMNPDRALHRPTHGIIGRAIEVHRRLGPKRPEAYHGQATGIERPFRGIRFERRESYEVTYPWRGIGSGRVDFFLEDTIIVELEAIDALQAVRVAQAFCHLRAMNKRLARVIHLNVKLVGEGVRRIAD